VDLYPYIVIASICLILGLGAGFVMHRSNYCIAGAFRDMFMFKQTFMIKTFVLLVIATMVLFELARQAGMLTLYPFPLLYSPTPANVIGGFLFGIGMVLAGGCVVGTLYKMGAGSILSAISFLGLIAGSALYAEIHPLWASFIRQTTFFPGRITLPQILGINPAIAVTLISALGIMTIAKWYRDGSLVRKAYAEGYMQPWKAAILLSLISLVSYVLIGMPLGITSSYSKIAGYLETIFAGEHLNNLAYFKTVPLKYTNPLTNVQLEGGGGPRFDVISAIQFPLVAGIILGSAISALLLKEFHLHFKAPHRQYASAALGGVIMGLASRMAPTCNVWHLMGGLPILAASSILFLAGILPGAWTGGMILRKLLMTNGRGPS
jgi:hypothetical protein